MVSWLSATHSRGGMMLLLIIVNIPIAGIAAIAVIDARRSDREK